MLTIMGPWKCFDAQSLCYDRAHFAGIRESNELERPRRWLEQEIFEDEVTAYFEMRPLFCREAFQAREKTDRESLKDRAGEMKPSKTFPELMERRKRGGAINGTAAPRRLSIKCQDWTSQGKVVLCHRGVFRGNDVDVERW